MKRKIVTPIQRVQALFPMAQASKTKRPWSVYQGSIYLGSGKTETEAWIDASKYVKLLGDIKNDPR